MALPKEKTRLRLSFSARMERHACACTISREALDDDLQADTRDKVEVFRENRNVIEQAARQKYVAGDRN
jgi:hypothetical protein